MSLFFFNIRGLLERLRADSAATKIFCSSEPKLFWSSSMEFLSSVFLTTSTQMTLGIETGHSLSNVGGATLPELKLAYTSSAKLIALMTDRI